MLKSDLTTISDKWFYFFLLMHVLVWTLVPLCVRYNLPMDSLEGATWGQQLEWGYDKNPYLNAWLTALAVNLGAHTGGLIYLFSELSVAACFWATWRLAKRLLNPMYALMAVMFLELIQYYNLHAIDFNDNTLELSLWALTIWFFYGALRDKKTSCWLLTGLFAGLGMMAKYYTAILLAPLFCFLLSRKENRAAFKEPSLYLGLGIFVLIILPHLIWLFHHDFVTLDYALYRVSAKPSWFNHLYFPAQFTWQQWVTLFPALVLFAFAFIGRKPIASQTRLRLASFDLAFLFWAGVGPFILTIMISCVAGLRLRAGWGVPLMTTWGILLFAWLQPRMTLGRFYRYSAVCYITFAAIATSYAVALIRAPEPSSANFPGDLIATTLTQEWHNTYHKPLKFVAGSRWMAGNIAFYSTDHPHVFLNWDTRLSPWIDVEKMKKDGAIFVWDMVEEMEKLPKDIIPQYANLGEMRVMHFTWKRNKTMKPVEVGVAFLPPSDG